MAPVHPRGLRIVDAGSGKHGHIAERLTIGQIFPGQPSYPHVYEVAYDDGSKDTRMHYHLEAENE